MNDSEAAFESENTEAAETKSQLEGVELKQGDTKEAENYKFTLENAYFTAKLSEKHGNVTNSFGNDGKYYFVLQLNYTNLSTEAFSGSFPTAVTDAKLVYQGKYNYEGDCRTLSNDIVSLDTAYVYVYYEVPKSMESDNGSVIAGFTLYGDRYYFALRNESAGDDTGSTDAAPAAKPATDQELHIGDERDNGDSKMVLTQAFFTDKLSEKHGNVTNSFGNDGKYYYALQFSFTNLSDEEFSHFHSDRVTDCKLKYDNKYEYEGNGYVLTGDIVPLDTANLYIYFEVPELISEDDKPLMVRFTVDGCSYTFNGRAA